jgi:hypothetical protein
MRRKARVQTALEVISLYDATPLALCALAIVKLRMGRKDLKNYCTASSFTRTIYQVAINYFVN